MNEIQIKCFVLLAHRKNFSKVAERLFLTQPAVSHQIKSLEQELGVTLFERTTTSVTVTEIGEMLLPCAEKILEQLDLMHTTANRYSSEVKIVTIGLPSTMMLYERDRYRQIMDRLQEKYPHLQINAKLIPNPDKSHAVLSGEVDIQMTAIFPKTDPGLCRKRLFFSHMLVGMKKEDPLAENAKIDIHQLAGKTVFLESRDDTFTPMVKKTMNQLNLGIKTKMIDSLDFAIMRIRKSGGYMISNDDYIKDPDIVFRVLDLPPTEIALVWQKKKESVSLLKIVEDISAFYSEAEDGNWPVSGK